MSSSASSSSQKGRAGREARDHPAQPLEQEEPVLDQSQRASVCHRAKPMSSGTTQTGQGGKAHTPSIPPSHILLFKSRLPFTVEVLFMEKIATGGSALCVSLSNPHLNPHLCLLETGLSRGRSCCTALSHLPASSDYNSHAAWEWFPGHPRDIGLLKTILPGAQFAKGLAFLPNKSLKGFSPSDKSKRTLFQRSYLKWVGLLCSCTFPQFCVFPAPLRRVWFSEEPKHNEILFGSTAMVAFQDPRGGLFNLPETNLSGFPEERHLSEESQYASPVRQSKVQVAQKQGSLR